MTTTEQPRYGMKYMMISVIAVLMTVSATASAAGVQDDANNDEHIIGIRYGYGLSGVVFDPSDMGGRIVPVPLNISLLYTYNCSLWDKMPYFGLQTGFRYGQEAAYLTDIDKKHIRTDVYSYVELPFMSQFRIARKNNKVLINIGAYGAYRTSISREGGFNEFDIRPDFGVTGGIGYAYMFKPFEIQIDLLVRYGFGELYRHDMYGDERWIYSNPYQITLGVSFNLHLERYKDKRRRR